MITACRLWEKTSAKGDRYMVGRIGSLRVLVLENNRRDGDSDNAHKLMFAEPLQRDSQPGHTGRAMASKARASARRCGKAQQIGDDPVPF
jgi:hypothetical protein